MPEYTISTAKPEELPVVLDILDDAAAWLSGEGIQQWPESFSRDNTWRIDRIRNYVNHGLTRLVRDEIDTPVATFTLSPAADPEFSHGWPDGPDAGGYIFRMAVRRQAAGKDLGGVMLDWAAAEVRRWGRPWLRLDVHRHNKKLQAYYERHGFEKVAELTAGDASIPGRTRGSGALMQRPTTEGVSEMADQRWDPDGTAAAWLEAANMILDIRMENPPVSENAWNSALEQASLALSTRASEIKQAAGMYYRPLTTDS